MVLKKILKFLQNEQEKFIFLPLPTNANITVNNGAMGNTNGWFISNICNKSTMNKKI